MSNLQKYQNHLMETEHSLNLSISQRTNYPLLDKCDKKMYCNTLQLHSLYTKLLKQQKISHIHANHIKDTYEMFLKYIDTLVESLLELQNYLVALNNEDDDDGNIDPSGNTFYIPDNISESDFSLNLDDLPNLNPLPSTQPNLTPNPSYIKCTNQFLDKWKADFIEHLFTITTFLQNQQFNGVAILSSIGLTNSNSYKNVFYYGTNTIINQPCCSRNISYVCMPSINWEVHNPDNQFPTNFPTENAIDQIDETDFMNTTLLLYINAVKLFKTNVRTNYLTIMRDIVKINVLSRVFEKQIHDLDLLKNIIDEYDEEACLGKLENLQEMKNYTKKFSNKTKSKYPLSTDSLLEFNCY